MNLEEVESDGRSLVQLDAGSANFNTTLNLTGYMSFLTQHFNQTFCFANQGLSYFVLCEKNN